MLAARVKALGMNFKVNRNGSLPELECGVALRTTATETQIIESDGRTPRLVQTVAVLVFPSSLSIVIGLSLYYDGMSRVLFIITIVSGIALSVGLAFYAWKFSPVLHQPREIMAWNQDGKLIRLWGEPVDVGVCRVIRSRPEVHDTISGHGVYTFVYECECEKDGQVLTIELFWCQWPCGWKLKRAGKLLGFPVHGL